MFKRSLAILCVVMMLATSSAMAEANQFGWEVPTDTISFTAFIAQDNWVELEEQKQGAAAMKQYLLDNFNVDYTYTTTDGTADEALNLMLASGDYPDVIRGAEIDVVQKFIDQGKAVDLAPYLEKMPTLTSSIGNMMNMYKTEAGNVYYLPSEYGGLMDLPDYSAHLRYDEWLEIGSPVITTPDDWFNAIMAILEKHPTTPSGETRYSLSLYNQGAVDSWLTGYWGLQSGFKVADDNSLTYWAFTDEGKAMSQFFNKFWRTGTMDPDTFTNKWDDFRTKVGQERIVGLIGGWWIGYNAGHEVWSLTNPDWTENMRFFQVSFKAPEADKAYVTMKNLMGSSFTVITDKAKDVEGITKWIDFLATEPGMALSSWGMPGAITSMKDPTKQITVWTIENPTTFTVDPTSKQQLLTETWDYNDEGIFGANLGQLTMSINRRPLERRRELLVAQPDVVQRKPVEEDHV